MRNAYECRLKNAAKQQIQFTCYRTTICIQVLRIHCVTEPDFFVFIYFYSVFMYIRCAVTVACCNMELRTYLQCTVWYGSAIVFDIGSYVRYFHMLLSGFWMSPSFFFSIGFFSSNSTNS